MNSLSKQEIIRNAKEGNGYNDAQDCGEAMYELMAIILNQFEMIVQLQKRYRELVIEFDLFDEDLLRDVETYIRNNEKDFSKK